MVSISSGAAFAGGVGGADVAGGRGWAAGGCVDGVGADPPSSSFDKVMHTSSLSASLAAEELPSLAAV